MVNKTLRSALGIVIASFLTLLIYLFSAIFMQAAANDSTAENPFDWLLFFIMLFCAVVFCLVLVSTRHHGNDDSENEFMKEYRDEPYQGMRKDITRAITSDLPTYILAYLIMGSSMICLIADIPIAPLVFFMPLMGLMTVLHPILGFLLHLTIFSVLYTFCLCFIRNHWAHYGSTGTAGVISQQHLNAMRWTRQNRR
jgi:hypothetical protein